MTSFRFRVLASQGFHSKTPETIQWNIIQPEKRMKQYLYFIYLFVCLLACFLGLHPRHMEVPRLGAEWELQLPAYATATATPDPSHICDRHHSSWQCPTLNPLSGARDRTHILMETTRVFHRWATMRTPIHAFLGNSQHGSAETNPTRNHKFAGLIPGLAQWVECPSLLWAVV